MPQHISNFTVGELVALKSDVTTALVVNIIEGDLISCLWFDENKDVKNYCFKEHVLIKFQAQAQAQAQAQRQPTPYA